MDHERYLISSIAASKSLAEVTESGIKAEFFLDATAREVYAFILEHKVEYGNVPSIQTLKESFPTYALVNPVEPIQFFIDKLRKQHTASLLERGMRDAVEAYDQKDYKEVGILLNRTLGEVARDVPNTRDTDITQNGDERMQQYLALKDLPKGLRGIPTGFPSIDHATLGFQPGQFINFVGFSGQGKSTMQLIAAMAAHDAGKRVAAFTFEMSTEEQTTRFDSIAAGIDHHRLQSGTLLPHEWAKLEAHIEKMKDTSPFIFSADTMAVTTVSGLASKIEVLQPDIVFVDGVYLMSDEQGEPDKTPLALSHITGGIKRLAMNAQIPIVGTTQALEGKTTKRDGVTGYSVGYSNSFMENSDGVIAVEGTDDPFIKVIKGIKLRNAAGFKKYIHWDWSNGTFEEMDDEPTGGDDGFNF